MAVVLLKNQYDELGELSLKNLGRARNSLTDTTYSPNPIDTLRYTYNIRGWLRGINKDYANAANGASNWFGMELNYDYGFSTSQLNGNIAGMKWRNAEDGQQRAYGFTYDAVNRLTKADFTQNTAGWNLSAGIDFSVHSIAYDLNGNITNLNQMGVKLNTPVLVDSLLYGYNTNSNQLNHVTDRVNDTTAHLGDFTEITNNTSQDYTWDGDGSLTQDNNKNITLIHYDYLNLPDSIRIKGKGYIKYTYDAAGIKLQKITTDSTTGTVKTTRTDYAGLFIYQNDTLQYVATEEGRVRPKTPSRSDTMLYDYFEKDHLGNTRVVLTDERQQDVYPSATLENFTSVFATEENFYTINPADTISTSRIASWGSTTGNNYKDNNGNPPYNNNPAYTGSLDTSTSKVVYQLNGATGDNAGLGITLKVMAGDVVNIYAKSFWHSSGTNPANTYYITNNIVPFINAFAGTAAVVNAAKGATGAALNAPGPSSAGFYGWLGGVPTPANPAVPRAYINWILFNDQFVPVASGSGFDLVSTSSDNVKSHNPVVNISTGGYLYVYCSNESNINVYFDNLQVIQTRGPLLEVDNHYPFGLTQAGISSQAAGKLENLHKFNKGSELQHKEFSDGSGLETYTTQFRMLDPQLGRWWQIDLKPDYSQSLYASMGNNPILHNDYLGDTPTNGATTVPPALIRKPQVSSENTGYIRKRSSADYQSDPVGATISDIGYYVALFTGVKAIDNAITTFKNPNAKVGDKVVAVLFAAISISGDKPGESSELTTVGSYTTGTYKALTQAGLKDAHHVIQDAAVRELPGYSKDDAIAVQLEGPSNQVGTPHYNATQSQRVATEGGTYGGERTVAYNGLVNAGIPPEMAKAMVQQADAYFTSIGVSEATTTRIPGNR